jgi:hypothetical protein
MGNARRTGYFVFAGDFFAGGGWLVLRLSAHRLTDCFDRVSP